MARKPRPAAADGGRLPEGQSPSATNVQPKAKHRVTLNRVVHVRGFAYKPGQEHVVSDAVLEQMQAAGAVSDVTAA